MENKYLDAKGKGEIKYDYDNDILLFKIKDREYTKSIDFDENNLTVDIDSEGFITGIRIFDASKLLKQDKIVLNNATQFEFNAKIEDKIITIQLRFVSVIRNKPVVTYGQDFVREALSTQINDSEVLCTVA